MKYVWQVIRKFKLYIYFEVIHISEKFSPYQQYQSSLIAIIEELCTKSALTPQC